MFGTERGAERTHGSIVASTMTKRAFLNKLLIFIYGILSVIIAWGVGRFAAFGFASRRKRGVPKELVSRLEDGSPLHVSDAGVWLIRTKEGESVKVLDDRCPHLGCKPNWNSTRRVFECPCHGSEFDLNGGVKKGPAARQMTELYLQEGSAETFVVSDRPSQRK